MNSFFQAEDGIRDWSVTGVQTCALPISSPTSFTTFLVPSRIAVQWAQTLKCASMRARISGSTSPSRKLEISRQTSRQLISITFIGYGGFLLVSRAWQSLALPRPHLFVLLLAGVPAPINT